MHWRLSLQKQSACRLKSNRVIFPHFLPVPGCVGLPKTGPWKNGAGGAAVYRSQGFHSAASTRINHEKSSSNFLCFTSSKMKKPLKIVKYRFLEREVHVFLVNFPPYFQIISLQCFRKGILDPSSKMSGWNSFQSFYETGRKKRAFCIVDLNYFSRFC